MNDKQENPEEIEWVCEMTDNVLESFLESQMTESSDFEKYALELRGRFYAHPKQFKKRVNAGCQAIKEQLHRPDANVEGQNG